MIGGCNGVTASLWSNVRDGLVNVFRSGVKRMGRYVWWWLAKRDVWLNVRPLVLFTRLAFLLLAYLSSDKSSDTWWRLTRRSRLFSLLPPFHSFVTWQICSHLGSSSRTISHFNHLLFKANRSLASLKNSHLNVLSCDVPLWSSALVVIKWTIGVADGNLLHNDTH